MPKDPHKTYEYALGRLAKKVIEHFGIINKRTDLTDQDKATLKAYYLDHFLTPRAKRLLTNHFPQSFDFD